MYSGLYGQQKKGTVLFCGQDELNGYMEKSSSGAFFQVHKPDVRNRTIAKQQLINGHHVEEGCQLVKHVVGGWRCCVYTGTMLYYYSL